MENILASTLILFVLIVSGYWLYVILGSPGKSLLSCLVISAWTGLLAVSLSLLNIHCYLKTLSVSQTAKPLILLFSCFSFIALLLTWKRLMKLSINHYSLFIFLLAFIAILFISTPFLESKSLTYYFSHNHEFIQYAFMSDMEQFNSYSKTLGVAYREMLVSLLCALFATLFSKSTFFLVQPLSYSLTWLSYLNFGLLISAIFLKKSASYWIKVIGLVYYFIALIFPAGQQFWTASFLSQYYNQAIAIGLIIFLVLTNLISSADCIRHILALGLAFCAFQCAYPEQALPTALIITFIYIFLIDKFSWFNFKVRVGILLGALAVAFFVDEMIIKYSSLEKVYDLNAIQHPIIRESLKYIGIKTLHLEITSMADIPAGTGLGSSGSFTTAFLKTLHALKKNLVHPEQLAEQACHIEIERLAEPIGKQDQYIAAYGGLTCFEFLVDGKVKAFPLNVDADTLYNLEDNLLLFFTGYSRSAASILNEQNSRTKAKDKELISQLHLIKELGLQSKHVLESGDLNQFAKLMDRHWRYKQARSKRMSNDQINQWYELALENGALGGKLIGAGGGGFLMFYVKDKALLRGAMRNAGLHEVRFCFDFEGTKLLVQS